MGCFDTVRFVCPSCGNRFEIQSKAGACAMKNYNHTSVPVDIAASLDGDSESCPGCGAGVRIVANMPNRVALYVELAPTEDDEDWD